MADGTEKIDMSLDDIIKINKKKSGGSKFRSNNNNNTNNNSKASRSKIRPKIQQQQSRQRPQPQRVQKQSPQKDNGPTMLLVSNLDFGVSNTDLKELFEEIGPIKKASVHYDRSGRSLGTAEVVFWKRDAAVRAIKEYNLRVLDGRPMAIALVPNRSNPSTSNSGGGSGGGNSGRVMGVKKGSGIQKRSPQKVGGGRLRNQGQSSSPRKGGNTMNQGGRKGRPTRQPKKEVSAQDLDADLDAYLSKNQMVVD